MLQDSYGREISYLRLSVTDKCNLRCQYCMPAEGLPRHSHKRLLRIEEFYRLVDLFSQLGVDKVRITGGEPLVRKGIVEFIEQLGQLPLADLSLTTNGILLPDLAQRLREAGLNRVNISLDSLDPERFSWITRGGHVDEVLRGIESAIAAGLGPVKLNMVVVRGFNDDEVWKMTQLTRDLPLHLRFIELMPVGTDSFWTQENFVASEETKARLAEQGAVLTPMKIRGNGPAEVFSIEGFQGTVGFIHAVSSHFCDKCNRIRLTSDGKIYPCLHSGRSIDIIDPLRSGCSDEEMKAFLIEAVKQKPQRSALGEQSHCMFTIGG